MLSIKDSEIWLVSGRPTLFTEKPDIASLPQVRQDMFLQ